MAVIANSITICDPVMPDVTQILSAIEAGDRQAADCLLPLVYEELRRIAAAQLRKEKPGHTLNPTALVHEAYIRLVGPTNSDGFATRGHFFAAAAASMRRILVESARRRSRLKRGGKRHRVELADMPSPATSDDLLSLDEALTSLAREDSDAARVVELRHFAGLGHEDVAATLGITVYEARQKWTYARAWMRNALGD